MSASAVAARDRHPGKEWPDSAIVRLIETAEMTAGYFGLVDDVLKQRIATLVRAIIPTRADATIEGMRQVRQLIASRIEMAADRIAYPEIEAERIERPIFVVGAPRTGTTILQALLALDEGARTPLALHTRSPSPPPGAGPVTQMRIDRVRQDLIQMLEVSPGLLKLHPYWDKYEDTLIEDEEVFALDFQNCYPTLLYRVPGVTAGVGAKDAAGAYRFHRQFLQHMQWRQPTGHWVCKGVYHQWALEALLAEYPDALCIWPHRAPSQVYPSMLNMVASYYGSMTNWTQDFTSVGRTVLERAAAGLERAIASPMVDDPRVLHVSFKELSADPAALVAKAYQAWDMPVRPAFQEAMQGWLADPGNRADRYGRHSYDLAPFGITKEEIDEIFAVYRQRFSL
ncbi:MULTISPECIES: sulfotransferase [unclassified Sphingobium]|uniref:sulfotransferase n=1 Tax=unclassified Sphingobium TaxID=2611147 RepID=UPI000D162CC3|nr:MULTISPECIES: sulfotransferase [unclassified Sphingobium]MBG6120038.1 hypothetical protein [Sphingobium sp. JAI105]PSO12906.1 sulfotransferase [Sphingobium sp. AEW4]TWD05761.1 sulfotransferase family protein [Sphingobium sp. AEW010]TWD23314.1 sulfotransferase family protein [Sphingobium sp. AEW013]TWD25174.1 sulfotransferase family protein [Sphingobium sp. AEW001]